MNTFFIAREISEIPCAKCGGKVIEFSVPNVIWNKVVRHNGKEHKKEYLCVWCFLEYIFNYIEGGGDNQ